MLGEMYDATDARFYQSNQTNGTWHVMKRGIEFVKFAQSGAQGFRSDRL